MDGLPKHASVARRCSRCGIQKPEDEFYRGKRRARCISCMREENRVRSADEARKVRKAVTGAAWRENNVDRRAALGRAWRAANPDKTLAKGRKYAEAHRRDRVEAGKAWRAAHPERAAESRRKWATANKPARRAVAGLYRARKAGARSDPAPLMRAWEALCKSLPCDYCGTAPSEHFEHMVPLSRGGQHTVLNTTGACARCNLSKGPMAYPDEWTADGAR